MMSETSRQTTEPAMHPGSTMDSLRPFRSMDGKLRVTQSPALGVIVADHFYNVLIQMNGVMV